MSITAPGLYPAAAPFVLGMEGAGVVEAVGEGGGGWRPGARVGYCVGGMGAYADCRLIKTDALIPLPDDLPFEEAAAVLLKGMTAEYLIRRVYRVRRGDSVLFHAAAGGVGLVACQWLKQLGATVIGTVGGEKKADIAKANGCDNVILYNREDVAARARELTGGIGVPVAYDSVGRATFRATLESLAPRGMFVSFGNASGAVEPFAPLLLAQHGSLFFTRPTLMAYCPPGPTCALRPRRCLRRLKTACACISGGGCLCRRRRGASRFGKSRNHRRDNFDSGLKISAKCFNFRGERRKRFFSPWKSIPPRNGFA